MKPVIWTFSALADLDGIRRYIAVFNPSAARSIADRIISAANSLGTFPYRGRQVPGTQLRESVVARPYIIRYRIDQDRVVFLRVRYGARRPTSPRTLPTFFRSSVARPGRRGTRCDALTPTFRGDGRLFIGRSYSEAAREGAAVSRVVCGLLRLGRASISGGGLPGSGRNWCSRRRAPLIARRCAGRRRG